LGLGIATLISTTGKPCIQVGAVDGVSVSGFLLQAGATNSPTLLQFGTHGYPGNAANPGVISDLYARVGGMNPTGSVATDTMVNIDNGNVLLDNAWRWRADHDISGLVSNSRNPVNNGLVVNGDHVTTYGLAAEHTLQDITIWNGNYGRSYFYQSELPYDATEANFGAKGYAGYRVTSGVTDHTAFGTGVYSYFRDHPVVVNSGIVTPSIPTVTFNHALIVFLNGHGSIRHVVDSAGSGVYAPGHVQYECYYQGPNPLATTPVNSTVPVI